MRSTTIDECVASCDGGCPLVLGGESMGGGAAIVASVEFARHNPEVITFAAPKAIKQRSACSDINEENHYRFINTQLGQYDLIIMQWNLFCERHVGWPIYLDDDNSPLMTTELSESDSRMPANTQLHEWSLYMSRIEEMADRVDQDSFPVSKWPVGHYCNFDDE